MAQNLFNYPGRDSNADIILRRDVFYPVKLPRQTRLI